MKVRIQFNADIVIEGENMEEVKSKWMTMPLFSKEAMENSVEFNEVTLVDDADTYEDLMSDFNKC